MQSHTMELPRLIVVGENNLNEFGEFLFSLNKPKKISLISGINVKKILKNKLQIFVSSFFLKIAGQKNPKQVIFKKL